MSTIPSVDMKSFDAVDWQDFGIRPLFYSSISSSSSSFLSFCDWSSSRDQLIAADLVYVVPISLSGFKSGAALLTNTWVLGQPVVNSPIVIMPIECERLLIIASCWKEWWYARYKGWRSIVSVVGRRGGAGQLCVRECARRFHAPTTESQVLFFLFTLSGHRH